MASNKKEDEQLIKIAWYYWVKVAHLTPYILNQGIYCCCC